MQSRMILKRGQLQHSHSSTLLSHQHSRITLSSHRCQTSVHRCSEVLIRSPRSYRRRDGHNTITSASADSQTVLEAAPSSSIPQASAWEIDFCSRPLLDERGKKVWELLICDQDRTFEYSEYFPNSKINSAEVRGCNTQCSFKPDPCQLHLSSNGWSRSFWPYQVPKSRNVPVSSGVKCRPSSPRP